MDELEKAYIANHNQHNETMNVATVIYFLKDVIGSLDIFWPTRVSEC